ncbi:MAG: S8 family serine peptidase, partial [Thermoplasmata archaeon]
GTRPGLLLFNGTGVGPPYDRVLVDLDADLSFVGEKVAWINTDWATFDPRAELIFRDVDGDGVQDLSGGMVYFIADGIREIPYASHQIRALNFTVQTLRNNDSFDPWVDLGVDPMTNRVPGAGDLVAIFGDLNGPGTLGSHGTWVTSALVGQGITGGGAAGPVLKGMAPGAKIIGAGNNFADADPFGQTSLWTSLIFATEGYDGVEGTGDEAHIASNSWGAGDWAGWEWGARFADYVSTVRAGEGTLFVFAGGNAGPGYGGRGGPAGGASLLVAGAMENFRYRTDPWFLLDGGPHPSAGETASFSTRGPSALGRHLVDALTSGEFGYGADPLNDNPFASDSGVALDGNSSWVLWSGGSLATPNLAGIAALVYDAYMEAHGGTAPSASTAKTIVKNGADDAHQDPFLAGAGIANALRSVRIASETDGLTTSLDEWYPGDYRGVVYPGYAHILPPGGGDAASVNVTNHRPSVLTLTIEDTVLVGTGSLSLNFSRRPLTTEDVFLLNDTGILATNGSVLVPAPPGLFASADAIRVTMFFNRSRMAEVPAYLLRLFDWTDTDASGTFDGPGERNLMVQGWISFDAWNGPNGFAFVHDPANRTHAGVVILLLSLSEDSVTGPIPFTLQVDYFKRGDFPWLEVAPTNLAIGPSSTAPVNLTVTVPADADPGLYEAMILLRLDDGNVTTLPVVVNVAPAAMPTTYGGNAHDAGPYQQGIQYGGWWDVIEAESSGDFRYYFFDLPAESPLTVLLEWDDPSSVHDVFVLSNATDWFSETLPSRYGPGTQREVAFRPSDSAATSLQASMRGGLGILVIRSRFLAGGMGAERPTGEAGVITVTPSPWTGSGVRLEGRATFTLVSDLAFPDVTGSAETGSLLRLLNQTVDPFPCTSSCGTASGFLQYLFDAPNTVRTEVSSGVVKATYTLTFHSGARDVDMGIFYDRGCDGAYTVDDDVIGSTASTNRNPEVATIEAPPAGCYWIHIAGFDVAAGSRYDLVVTLISEPFVTFISLPPRIDPGVPADVVVTYALPPLPETFGGTLFLGSAQFPQSVVIPIFLSPDLPPFFLNETPRRNAFIMEASPTVFVELRDFPDAFTSAIDPRSVAIWLDGANLTSLASITPTAITLPLAFALGEGVHTVAASAADLSGSRGSTSWNFTVDLTAPILVITSPVRRVTNDPNVRVAGVTEVGVTVTIGAMTVSVRLDGTFEHSLRLPEGLHAIDVVAQDGAGNANAAVVSVEVDTRPPALILSSPTNGTSTADATILVTGTTEPGASVRVNGIVAEVSSNGSFSLLLALTEGENPITATATDSAGNDAGVSVSVTFTNPVPGLEQNLALLQAVVLVLGGVLALTVVGLLLWRRGRGWR